MAAGALWGLVAALETHRGRDRAVRALSYGCQLAGAALPGPGGLPGGLLAASAQLSSCRTALRLFDDLAMLRHSCSYGLGPEGEDALVRGLSVLCNVANQLYYPCEHLAWAADVGIVRAASQKWWTRSTALWGCALLLGILRYGRDGHGDGPALAAGSLRILFQLRRKLSQHKCTSPQRQQKLRAQVKAELLSILMDTADLSNAIHWLPPGFLWAGRFPPWLVGLLGTISSLIGIYQASRGANSEAA
ncbi:peroxisomal membrane protein 11C isoform X2 [Motacilla alba alba]|uniref:peroxisomal membrane protein 11C isoform X2 n=1 Tax=Motacilla alba alba TaxID=1094192 RepID=UPI0018D5A169|nr:peroxisomal membrane protein 11C isoform X2 [Motacilla alba alba]